jgi:hypothetical protein
VLFVEDTVKISASADQSIKCKAGNEHWRKKGTICCPLLSPVFISSLDVLISVT